MLTRTQTFFDLMIYCYEISKRVKQSKNNREKQEDSSVYI